MRHVNVGCRSVFVHTCIAPSASIWRSTTSQLNYLGYMRADWSSNWLPSKTYKAECALITSRLVIMSAGEVR